MDIRRHINIIIIIVMTSLIFTSCNSTKNDDAYVNLIADFDTYVDLVRHYTDNENKEEDINEINKYTFDKSNFVFDIGDRSKLINSLNEALRLIPNDSADFYYKIEDINSNGKAELMLYGPNDTLLALFTTVDEKTVLLDAFYSRYDGVITENGRLLINNHSYGYTKSTVQLCEISAEGNKLTLICECGAEIDPEDEKPEKMYYRIRDDEKEYISEDEYNSTINMLQKGEEDLRR